MFDLKKATEALVKGSIIVAQDGTRMYTPDGKASYDAFWVRDFTYMAEYAGEFIPDEDLKNGICYFLSHTDKNGWIPDRVDASGHAYYTAGYLLPASPNLDNGCFLPILADVYLRRLKPEDARAQFLQWNAALCRGLDILPCDEHSIISNQATPPHSPYGFTDTISKTGLLAMETLLLWRACRVLHHWQTACGMDGSQWLRRISDIETHFASVFADESGMLLAATGTCRQIDIWASCYAVAIDFPLPPALRSGISGWLAEHYSTVTQHGQVRHLPACEYWEKTFLDVAPGSYQNGAYWATPAGWSYLALKETQPALACRQMEELLRYFETEGIYECINHEEKKLDTYVASAANVYAVYPDYQKLKASLS